MPAAEETTVPGEQLLPTWGVAELGCADTESDGSEIWSVATSLGSRLLLERQDCGTAFWRISKEGISALCDPGGPGDRFWDTVVNLRPHDPSPPKLFAAIAASGGIVRICDSSGWIRAVNWDLAKVEGRPAWSLPSIIFVRVLLTEDSNDIVEGRPHVRILGLGAIRASTAKVIRRLLSERVGMEEILGQPGFLGRLHELSRVPVLVLIGEASSEALGTEPVLVSAEKLRQLGIRCNYAVCLPYGQGEHDCQEMLRSLARVFLAVGASGVAIPEPFHEDYPNDFLECAPAILGLGMRQADETWCQWISEHHWQRRCGAGDYRSIGRPTVFLSTTVLRRFHSPPWLQKVKMQTAQELLLSPIGPETTAQVLAAMVPDAWIFGAEPKWSADDKIRRTVELAATSPEVARLLQARAARLPVRIFHVSDIHLGCFHQMLDRDRPGGEERYEIAESWLSFCASIPEHERPDVVVISGDLTSTASDEEFTRCNEFLTDLTNTESPCLRTQNPSGGAAKPPRERVLLVPGNHDVRWETARGDRLSAFQTHAVDWPAVTPLSSSDVVLPSSGPMARFATCPARDCVKIFDEYRCCFHLTLSCHYDGDIPEEGRVVLEAARRRLTWWGQLGRRRADDGEAIQQLSNRLRKSLGYMSSLYLDRLAHSARQLQSESRRSAYSRFGVTHHNPIQAGVAEPVWLSNPGEFLARLYDAGYAGLLCGHTHTTYTDRQLPRAEKRVWTFPAGTLGAVGAEENAFLVFDIFGAGRDGATRLRVRKCAYDPESQRWEPPADWVDVYANQWGNEA